MYAPGSARRLSNANKIIAGQESQGVYESHINQAGIIPAASMTWGRTGVMAGVL